MCLKAKTFSSPLLGALLSFPGIPKTPDCKTELENGNTLKLCINRNMDFSLIEGFTYIACNRANVRENVTQCHNTT